MLSCWCWRASFEQLRRRRQLCRRRIIAESISAGSEAGLEGYLRSRARHVAAMLVLPIRATPSRGSAASRTPVLTDGLWLSSELKGRAYFLLASPGAKAHGPAVRDTRLKLKRRRPS